MPVLDGVVDLSPNALTTVARAEAYVMRDASASSAIGGTAATPGDWIPVLINHATGLIERYCGRRLAARTYRTPVTINGTSTINQATVTGAGFSALKTLDDALGANLAAGSRIKTVDNDGQITLNRNAKASGLAAITFGSAPLTLSGEGSRELRVPESPLVALYSAAYLDIDGSSIAIDITAARILQSTPGESIIRLMSGDVFLRGFQNIQIECKAGIVEPSTTVLGDWERWYALERACLRLVQVAWQDFMQQVGRGGKVDLANMVKENTNLEIPEDVRDSLAPFRRIG